MDNSKVVKFAQVTYTDGMYESITGSDFQVQYRIGEITRAKIGGLFVFPDKETASRWISLSKLDKVNMVLLLCEHGDLRQCPGIVPCSGTYYRDFWMYGHVPSPVHSTIVPAGTLLTDWVKPIALIAS